MIYWGDDLSYQIPWHGFVGTCFWWDICEAMSFGALSQAYSRVLHDQDFPRRVDNVVYCNG